jgi:hypothetical protein
MRSVIVREECKALQSKRFRTHAHCRLTAELKTVRNQELPGLQFHTVLLQQKVELSRHSVPFTPVNRKSSTRAV